MLDTATRDLKERALAPLASILEPIHPTTVTVISLGFGLAAVLMAAQQLYGWALAFWALNRITDGLDGTLARMFGKQSDLGGYIDILADFLIYALIPVGIVIGAPSTQSFILLALLLSVFYVNAASWMYLSAILEKRSAGAKQTREMTSVTMPKGLVEGTETVVFYSLFLLFPIWTPWLFAVFASMILYTVIQRLVWAVRTL